VERITAADPRAGAILVLPWHTYLPFAWNRSQTVRQPASVYFSRDVVTSTSLEVGTSTLPEEDPWGDLMAGPATDSAPLLPRLGARGIRYVLLFKEVEWRSLEPKLSGLRRVLDAPDLSLYVSSGRATRPALPTVSPAPVMVGDAVSLALVLVALFAAFRPGAGCLRRSRVAMLREQRTET
jgi:hypothetical protein